MKRHVFSIATALHNKGRQALEGDWYIPEEAEVLFQSYWGRPDLSLDGLFADRFQRHDFSFHRWDWMLVILPGRYPIGGHLCEVRGGSSRNLHLLDHMLLEPSQSSKSVGCEPTKGHTQLTRDNMDLHVSGFWVPTRGLLRAMATRDGGWLAGFQASVDALPAEKNWIRFADAPPPDWVARVSDRNREKRDALMPIHIGPEWQAESDAADAAWCQALLASAQHADSGQDIRFLRSYVKRRPADARGWATLGWRYAMAGHHGRAVACGRKAMRLAPAWVFPRQVMMRSYFRLGRHDVCLPLVRDILAMSPLDMQAYQIAGAMARQQGDTDTAIAMLDRVVELNETGHGLTIVLGQLYVSRKQYDKARVLYESHLARNPDDASCLNDYGFMLVREGQFERALSMCELACRLERAPCNLDSLGVVYMNMGRYREAADLFEEALAREPDFEEARANLKQVGMMMRSKDGKRI